MAKTAVLLVLLLAATATVCWCSDGPTIDTGMLKEQANEAKDKAGEATHEAVKEGSSWTDWAMGKVSGTFNEDKVKGAANSVADKASDAEDSAADMAKKLSDKATGGNS